MPRRLPPTARHSLWLRAATAGRFRPYIGALAVFAVGAALACLAALGQARRNAQITERALDGIALRTSEQIVSRMQVYEYGLRGARGVVIGAGLENLDRARFRVYAESRDSAREFPGALGTGVVERVPPEAESAFVANARRSGFPSFTVRQLEAHDGERYVIKLVEPLPTNTAAVGLDIGSEPSRRAAAEAAMRSGGPTLSAPITLVQANDKVARAFLLLLPIYRAGSQTSTPAEREAATIGWSYSPLVIDDTLADVAFNHDVALDIRDPAALGGGAFFRSRGPHAQGGALPVRRVSVPLFGRVWEAEVRATPQLIARLNLGAPSTAAAIGLLLATTLAVLFYIARLAARREAETQTERARHSAIVECSGDAIIGETFEGLVTDWNAGAERLFGYRREHAIGAVAASLLLPADRAAEDAELRALIARGEILVPFESTRRRADGTLVDVSVAASPIIGANGRLVGLSKTFRDISESKRSARRLEEIHASLEAQVLERTTLLRHAVRDGEALEADLKKSHERIAMATDGGGIGVWEYDVTANVLVWDARMHRIYGQPTTGSALRYDLWVSSVHPDDRERAERELDEAMKGGPSFDTEFRIVQPTGEIRHVKAVAQIVRGDRGEPLRILGVNFDVTDRRRAESELLRTSSLLRTVLASVSDVSIIAIGPTGTVKVFNSGAERLLGYASDEALSGPSAVVFHLPEEIRARAEELTAQTGELVEGAAALIHPLSLGQPREWTFVRKDGAHVTVSLIITAMRGANGDLFGYVGVAHDVTRSKQYEESLRLAKVQAEEASRAKSRFLANMSHEIRTPMNAIMGLSYLLGQSRLDPEQASFVSKVSVASRSLLALINDILDFSKIEAGELTVERAAFDLPGLLGQVEDIARVQANAKQIRLTVDTRGDLPAALDGDATRLNQILTNLLSNAVKFTERGGVTLRVRVASKTPTETTLRFDVEDSGIGIPPEVEQRLFAPFAQADASTTRRFGGTGLGLSIVKRLAELMGGTVSLTSTEGVGSVFSVTLTFGVAKLAVTPQRLVPRSTGAGRQLHGLRVLVTDDSEVNLIVAKRILELHGASVSLSRNGQEAFERLATGPGDFDLVLMDLQMPVLDGCEATRRIRAELPVGGLPIIALTADARTTERERTQQAGMNDFISKPFEVDAVIQTIRRHVPVEGSAAVASPAVSAPPDEPAWPEIDGIDAEDVRHRLADDLELFWSVLDTFFEERAETSLLAETSEPAALSVHARAMHKLKGAAAAIGAKHLKDLAGETEAACRVGKADDAAALAERMSAEIQRIARSADRHRVSARAA